MQGTGTHRIQYKMFDAVFSWVLLCCTLVGITISIYICMCCPIGGKEAGLDLELQGQNKADPVSWMPAEKVLSHLLSIKLKADRPHPCDYLHTQTD